MNYRYSGYPKYPRIDLTPEPDGFTHFGGVVEVHFLELSVPEFEMRYSPHVNLNCTLQDLAPTEAYAWADTLKLAADIAAERLANLTPELRQMAESAHTEARKLAKETA